MGNCHTVGPNEALVVSGTKQSLIPSSRLLIATLLARASASALRGNLSKLKHVSLQAHRNTSFVRQEITQLPFLPFLFSCDQNVVVC